MNVGQCANDLEADRRHLGILHLQQECGVHVDMVYCSRLSSVVSSCSHVVLQISLPMKLPHTHLVHPMRRESCCIAHTMCIMTRWS